MSDFGRRGLIASRTAVLAVLVFASALVGVVSLGPTPASAVAGCGSGAGVIYGNIKVTGNGPQLTRSELTWNGNTTIPNKAMAEHASPNSTQDFKYCGKGLFDWPMEANTKYRINGPSVGGQATGYLVKIHTKIPGWGDNEVSCSIDQEYGPPDIDPFYCKANNITDSSYGRYAIGTDFEIGRKGQKILTNEHERARLLSDFCSKNDAHQCKYDPNTRITETYGPEELVASASASCTGDVPFTFNWTQAIITTETVGATATLGVNIGKLVPIVSASLSANYGFTFTQNFTASGTYGPYNIPKGQRLNLYRSALLNSVNGTFVLSGTGDTLYVVPNATFKWPSPGNDKGHLIPREGPRGDCPRI